MLLEARCMIQGIWLDNGFKSHPIASSNLTAMGHRFLRIQKWPHKWYIHMKPVWSNRTKTSESWFCDLWTPGDTYLLCCYPDSAAAAPVPWRLSASLLCPSPQSPAQTARCPVGHTSLCHQGDCPSQGPGDQSHPQLHLGEGRRVDTEWSRSHSSLLTSLGK